MYIVEYLNRIGVLSAFLDFKEEVNRITNISIRNSNSLIIGTKSNQNEIILPTQVESEKIQIQRVNLKDDCLSLTIKVEVAQEMHNKEETKPFVGSSVSRWSCKDLKQKTSKNLENKNQFTFKCTNCDSRIIDSNDYKFLDTPSEYWYEMMDFWHCHKPHGESTHDNSKKYDGKLKPRLGEVIVGNHYLIVNNTELIDSAVICQSTEIICASCGKDVGDVEDDVFKIFKWNLKLVHSEEEERFPVPIYVHNLIIDKVNLAATRKFKLYDSNDDRWVYIWVLNVDMQVSISTNVSNRAIKILYYETKDPEDFHLKEDSTERLHIPNAVTESFIQEINKVNRSLPQNMQKMTMSEDGFQQTYMLSYLLSI